MENYLKYYQQYNIKVVYHFKILNGGIGDYLKYFIFLFHMCIEKKYRLYFLIDNEIFIKQYLFMNIEGMYIQEDEIEKNKHYIKNYDEFINLTESDKFNLIIPHVFYGIFKIIPLFDNISNLFSFSNEVIENQIVKKYENINYISLHIRLGDKFLEIEDKFKNCKNDERIFDEDNVMEFLENHKDENIMLFCDNQKYKEKLKEKYNNVIITSLKIGHIGLVNTTKDIVLDTVIEFYLLTKSKEIYTPTYSGFPIMASKFCKVPIIYI